jgi:flagellar hook-associated protein 2
MAISFGGLASKLDTNAIIEQLVKIESNSVTVAQKRQAAYQSQISQIGDLIGKLQSLASASTSLKSTGALGLSQVGSTSGFSVTLGSAATSGRYAVTVDALAVAAKARSADFTSGGDTVRAGTLDLSINGTTTSISITEGMTLRGVAKAINDSGAAVSAVVLESNGKAVLSLNNLNTGFTPGAAPATALSITETSTGTTGSPLGLSITQQATNAKVTIDDVQFERSSNTIADALPGVTLDLKATTALAQDLIVSTDTAATASKLGAFISAYNDVMKVLRLNLNIGENDDRNKTLGGDGALRSIQSSMMGLVSSITNPGSAVRSLAELGVETGQDASLSIDQTRLSKAIATDPAAVNDLFQAAGLGVSDKIKALVDNYTNSSSGILVSKRKSYDRTVKQLDKQVESLQLRLDSYRTKLVNQFTAMEKVVSNFKNIGNYLTSQEKQNTSSDS